MALINDVVMCRPRREREPMRRREFIGGIPQGDCFGIGQDCCRESAKYTFVQSAWNIFQFLIIALGWRQQGKSE